jgi:FAD/FMN-containing dehydrogenase/Fe-S oxidoreductase
MTATPAIPLPVLSPAPRPARSALSDAEREQIAADLRQLGGGDVRFDRHNRLLYSTDASLYQVEPIGVFLPASVYVVGPMLAYCAGRGVAVLPRGGGTSLAGQCTNAAVVLDLSASCRQVVSVDPAARRCRVEPGIGIDELNRELDARKTGLFFAPDPATVAQAAIGGCIGNNAAGARSIRYGRTSENLAGVDVFLSSGERVWLGAGAGRLSPTARRLAEQVAGVVRECADEIRRRFPKLIRRNAGYGLDLIVQQLDRGVAEEELDLSGLICGSEGTLAVVVGADLKLEPVPKARGLAVATFGDLEAAIAAVVPILATRPSAVELLDDVVLLAADGNAECRPYVELLPRIEGRKPAAVLYVEYQAEGEGEPAAELEGHFAALRQVVPQAAMATYRDAASMGKAWMLRKSGEALLHGLPGARKPVTFVEDNSVPVEQLSRFVAEFKKIVARHGTEAAYYAHASVGVLHIRPMLNLHEPGDRAAMQAIASEVAGLARQCGGVMSGEHGDGRARGPLLEAFYGPAIMEAFRRVKRIFDPAGILNPGNIVGAGPLASIAQELRIDAESPTIDVDAIATYFNYPGGFAEATELCNGAGFCRKTAGGTMCPSYRATLDERHSTRGRANAIRVAVTGQTARRAAPALRQAVSDAQVSPLAASQIGDAPVSPLTASRIGDVPVPIVGGPRQPVCDAASGDTAAPAKYSHPITPSNGPRWGDPGVLETLDLCLSCKACKSECPSNVDVAQLKSEYLAQTYREAGGPPLRARVFGNVRLLNRIGSLTPRLANWVNGLKPVRRLTGRLLGLAEERSLPPFAPSLHRWFGKHRSTVSASTDGPAARPGRYAPAQNGRQTTSDRPRRPKVVLWPDCFTTYSEPAIGRAAVAVLEALGYCVELPAGGCCARPMISTGLLEQGAKVADRTLRSMRDAIDAADIEAIIVLEPSCLSAIQDDWLKLKLQTDIAIRRRLADKAMLLEQFVEKNWDKHPVKPVAVRGFDGRRVVLHGHCHQKALWGTESSAAALRRIAGDRLDVLPSGCCGMAGAFGYTQDHYALSMKIGDLSVFPPIRAAAADALIVAPGTSCRHQIRDGTGRECLHPAEVLAMALGSAVK